MQLADLFSRAGIGAPQPETAPNLVAPRSPHRTRLDALLPSSGIVLGPPESEDKLDLSSLAHAILRTDEQLQLDQAQRVERLRVAFLRDDLEVDADALASALTVQALAEAKQPPSRTL